jgi:2-polyprenyl-6-methoxyphenol hydroxylase-like FAD-dependent oxidoreductase
MDASQTDVAIVGAGPTGLALGAELRRLGVSAVILDRLAAGDNTSRAAVIHARTLEVLEPLGVTPELIAQGLKIETFRVRERSRVLATIHFQGLPTKYPFTVLCPQQRTEAVLLGRLQALGGHVDRPYEVVAITDAADGVALQYRRNDDLKTLHAKWVVGCDGMHSLVREQAAIHFEGSAYEESFILGDVQMDWPIDRDEVSLFFSGVGLTLVAPLPENHFRIVATMQVAPREPSIADFQKILEERGPENGTVRIRSLSWSSRFHVHHRLAKTFRKGHILLAGDAAHVHSPAGGQGMNTGIQDAISLAGTLRQVLQQKNEAALDAWQTKRQQIARGVVSLTDRMTKLATASSPAARLLRKAVFDIVGHVAFAQHAIAQQLSELDNR